MEEGILMITVNIDPQLEKFDNEIRYSFDFLFQTLGYSYRFIPDTSQVGPRDILVLYRMMHPSTEELRSYAKNNITIYLPAEPFLFQKGELSPEQIRTLLQEVKLHTTTPVLSEKKMTDVPLEVYSGTDMYGGKFNFDLIGNIYFQLAGMEEEADKKRDRYGRYPDNASAFHEYRDIPFLHNFLWAMDRILRDQVTKKKIVLAQRTYWPQGQTFAATVSHNIDRLQKWNLNALSYSVFEDLKLLFSFRWASLSKNVASKLKYIFTNYEMYWNFEEYLKLDKNYQVKTTYFLSPMKSDDTDYDACKDEEIQAIIKHILADGHDIGIYDTWKKVDSDHLRLAKISFQKLTGLTENGIRYMNSYLQPQKLEQQQQAKILYDSSLGFADRMGFRRGIAFPFYPYFNNMRSNHVEIPLNVKDDCLRISKYKQVPLEKSKSLVKKMIENVQRSNGLISFDFCLSNFEEIPYLEKLYSYVLELLKTKSVFFTTAREIAAWWDIRKQVTIEEGEFEISIYFPHNMKSFTVKVHGDVKLGEISGVDAIVENQCISFRNIKANQIAIVEIRTGNQSPDAY
jgi:hypothetical protein